MSATTEQILGAMAAALSDHNFEAVIELWKMLAVRDPHTASELLSIVKALP